MSPPHRSKPKQKSILVVDDESGIVDVLIAVLSDAGYRASGAAHGQEALSKLKLSVPDVMLLDVEMPVLDGSDTLRALKADAHLSAIGVVMMSGIPESMVRRRCRGFDAFLRKPFSLDDLLDTVRALSDDAAREPRSGERAKRSATLAGSRRGTPRTAPRTKAPRTKAPRTKAPRTKA